MANQTDIKQPVDIDPSSVLKRYIFDVVLILACLSASFIASSVAKTKAEYANNIINISGKQRMLSQHILHLSHRMQDAPSATEADHIRRAVDEFERAHVFLLKNDLMTPALEKIYFGEKPSSNAGRDVDALTRDLIRQSKRSLEAYRTAQNEGFHWVSSFDGETLLLGLDDAVSQFQTTANIAREELEYVQIITFCLAILIIVFEAFFIFRPALIRVRLAIEKDRALMKVQNNFLTKMSHEMRTPLNAVIGFSEVLSQGIFGKLSKPQNERIKDIHDSGQHLLSIVNDLLDLDRVSRDIVAVNCKREKLDEVIAYAIRTLEIKATEKNITIDYLPETARAIEVNIDHVRARQCIINILDNALKFSPADSIIKVTPEAQPDKVDLHVKDSGPGMKQHQITTAMRMFGQVAKDEFVAEEGLGIGLSLTAKLMEKQGGALTLTSAPQDGTTVTLSFQRA